MLEAERTSNNSHPEGFHVYLVITLQVPEVAETHTLQI